jgi:hypothetical protein
MLFSAGAHDTILYYEADSYSLSWSLGELAVESITSIGNPQFIITQGYHQPSYGYPLNSESEWKESNHWADIRVYPNPSPGEVRIEIEQVQMAQVEMHVYSIQGQLMLRKYFTGERISESIDLSHLQAGTYLLIFSNTTESPTSKTFRLIKTH